MHKRKKERDGLSEDVMKIPQERIEKHKPLFLNLLYIYEKQLLLLHHRRSLKAEHDRRMNRRLGDEGVKTEDVLKEQ